MDNRLLSIKQSSGRDTRYVYAVARIRALETKLLPKAFFIRLTELVSYDEALKALSEHPEYRQDIEGLKERAAFESILINQLKRLYSLVNELTRDKEITDVFLLRYDIENLKGLLIAGESKSADIGVFGIQTLKDCMAKKDFRLLGKDFEEFIIKINDIKEPQRIEFLFDKFYLGLLGEALLKTQSPFLEHIYKTIIDLFNIKISLRLSKILLEKTFLGGGYIEKDFFYKQEVLALKEFSNTAYYELVKGLLERKLDVHPDVILDDYLMGIIKEAKYFHFGIEPLIGYIFAKEYEVKNLRRILAGKFFGLEQELVKNSLEVSYV